MTSGNCMKYQGSNSYSMIYNTTIQLTVFYLLGTQHLLGMWDSKVLWYRDVYICQKQPWDTQQKRVCGR